MSKGVEELAFTSLRNQMNNYRLEIEMLKRKVLTLEHENKQLKRELLERKGE